MFLAVITDQVIGVIRQHVLPLESRSAWMPLGRTVIAGLHLATVVALYLLRVLLAPSETLRGLRGMVLDAAPVPEVTRIRPVSGEPLLCADHDHGIQEHGSGRPPEDGYTAEDDGQDQDRVADQFVTGFRTKKTAFLVHYRSHHGYGDRSAAGRIAAELAPLAGLQAGTGRTYIAEELRKLTKLALACGSAEEDNGQPAS